MLINLILSSILSFASENNTVVKLKERIAQLEQEKQELMLLNSELEVEVANLNLVLMEKPIVVKETVTKTVNVLKQNRLVGVTGVGPNLNGEREMIAGMQYQRALTEHFNVGVQVQSNNTTLLNLGIDF